MWTIFPPVLVIWLWLSPVCIDGTSVKMKPHTTECFLERVEDDTFFLTANFELLESRMLVSAKLEKADSDDEKIVWEVSKQREGNKLFHDPEPGLYKVVGQEAFVKQHKDMSIEERKVIKENFKNMINEGNIIMARSVELRDHYGYVSQREYSHMRRLLKGRNRIIGWTIMDAVLILYLALWRHLNIRRFMEIRKKI